MVPHHPCWGHQERSGAPAGGTSGTDQGHPRWRPPEIARIIATMDNDTNLLTPPPPPPGPAPGPAPRPRLTRRPDQGMVAGVAAGLGEYFDVDPVLFRVGFVVLAFVWGLAIPVYLAAWLLIPPAA